MASENLHFVVFPFFNSHLCYPWFFPFFNVGHGIPGRSQEAEAVRKAIWNPPNGHVVFFGEQLIQSELIVEANYDYVILSKSKFIQLIHYCLGIPEWFIVGFAT